MGETQKDELAKYIPLLKLPEFRLNRAADYLEALANDTLPQKPLFDLTQLLGLALEAAV